MSAEIHGGLVDPNLLLSLYEYGKNIKGDLWYEQEIEELKIHFGEDALFIAAIIAITSQGHTIKSNAVLAVKAYNQYRSGKPFTGYKQAVIDNLNRLIVGGQINGPKISVYVKNMTGDLYAVTVDRHMSKLYGFNEVPNKSQMEFITEDIKWMAEYFKTTPSRVQAAVWVAYRTLLRGSNIWGNRCVPYFIKAYQDYLKKQSQLQLETI